VGFEELLIRKIGGRRSDPYRKAPVVQRCFRGCRYNDTPVTSVLATGIKHWLKRLTLAGLASVLSVTALAYAGDYTQFRYRVATNRQPFAQITVTSYDAIPQKSGKTQFIFHPPEPQTCVNALFPHAGYVPCWYLQRHTEQVTNF
jgi:hypothetical protein